VSGARSDRWPRGDPLPLALRAGTLGVCAALLWVAPQPLWQGDSPADAATHQVTHRSAQTRHEMAALRQRLAELGRKRASGHLMHHRSAKPAPMREHSLATWPHRPPGARDDR